MSLHPLCNNFDATRFTGVAARMTELCSIIAVKASSHHADAGKNHNLTHGLNQLTMAKDCALEIVFSTKSYKYTECVRVRDDVRPTLERCLAGSKTDAQREVFQAYIDLYDLAEQYKVSDDLTFEQFQEISNKFVEANMSSYGLDGVDRENLSQMLYQEWQQQRASGQIQPQPNLWPILLLEIMVYLKESARAVFRSFVVQE